MSDADRHCARLRYEFQERTFQFFFKATMHTVGYLSLAPNVFALNYNFIEVSLTLCPRGTLGPIVRQITLRPTKG